MKRIDYFDSGKAKVIELAKAHEKVRELLQQGNTTIVEDMRDVVTYLNQEVPEPVVITAEQRKALGWLLDGGYDRISRVLVFDLRIRAFLPGMDRYESVFKNTHFVQKAFETAEWLKTEPMEIKELLRW